MQSATVAFNRRIALGIGPFQISLRHNARTAMARTDDVDHVEIIVLDQPVQMDIEKVQPRGCAPMTEQARLNVLELERLFQQRIILQVDLPRPKDNLRRANRRSSSEVDRLKADQAESQA
jgi:hypothetical protein